MIDPKKVAALYNERFEQYGRDIKTVGWGSVADQELRFAVLVRGLDLKGKTILDVGCGLGDLVSFLEQRTDGDFKYIGVDVAGQLVEDAEKVHGKSGRKFLTGDFLSLDLPQVDVSIMSGALTYNVPGIEEYAKTAMKRMYDVSREAACLNFMSSYVDYQLEKNKHFSPEAVFGQAKSLSKAVNLIHDYPLYEFTVQIVRPPQKAEEA